MNKTVIITLALALAITVLVGCSSNEAPPGTPLPQAQDVILPETQQTELPTQENEEDYNVESNEPLLNKILPGQIIGWASSPFSDGLAVVGIRPIDSPDTIKFWIINTYGEKLFSISENYPDYRVISRYIRRGGFQNGYLLLETPDRRITKVMDRNGRIVVDAEEQGFTSIMNHDGSSYVPDKYLFVYRISEDFTGAVLEIGVIDFNGNWIIPLSDSPVAGRITATNFSPNVIYLDEGMAWIYVSGGYGSLLNVNNNSWHNLSSHDVFNLEITERNRFYNGIMVSIPTIRGGISDEVFTMVKTGDVTRVRHGLGRTSGYALHFISGLLFMRDGGGYGFRNTDGIRVIDLSEFAGDSTLFSPGFQGDNALVFISNPLGTTFFTLIDRQGNALFNPIQSEFRFTDQRRRNPINFTYSEGIILHESRGNVFANNEDGEFLFVIPIAGIANGFREGFAIIRCLIYDESFYVDKTGTRVIG